LSAGLAGLFIGHEKFHLFPGFYGESGPSSAQLTRELACLKTKPAF
jgi:hypothetical protein